MAEASDSRPAPSATGTLAERPLAHVLVYARNKKLTGRFELHAPEGRSGEITFWRGRIADVKTNPPVAYFGAVVYELGWIDGATLDATLLELSKKKKKHGEILIERGAITEAQRDDALVEQACRKAHHLFSLPESTAFAFYDARTPSDAPAVLVDALGPAWRGIREFPPDRSIKDIVGRFGASRLSILDGAPIAALALSQEEKDLVNALALKPMTVAQMRSVSPLTAARIEQLAFLLIIAKCVELIASPSQPEMPAIRPSDPVMRAVTASDVAMQKAMLTPPDPIIPQPVPAKKASRPAMPRAIPTPGVMSSGEVRTRPPSFRVPSSGNMEAAKHPSSSSMEVVSPIIAPADLGLTGLAARAMTIENEGYFEVLGLPHGASVEAVRATFFRLAKVWHPDRVPADLSAMREEVAKVFAFMTRAQQTLIDPDARAIYLSTNVKTEKRPRGQVIREIDGHLSKGDFASAEMEAKRLVEDDADDVEALAVLAWCSATGGDAAEDVLRTALATLDRTVYGDRYCERAYYYRGVFHKRLGNDTAAVRDFSRVVAISPKHVDAQRELRLHEMRSRKSSGEHILSLFSSKKK